MSRRQRSMLTISVRVPQPAGVNVRRVLDFITAAIKEHKSPIAVSAPTATLYTLPTNEMIVKLEKKETVYL